MDFEKLNDWESMNVTGIIHVMVKWLNFYDVEFHTRRRDNVESGVWYEVAVRDNNFIYKWTVSSQDLSLLKDRLIKKLDTMSLRTDYLARRASSGQTDITT